MRSLRKLANITPFSLLHFMSPKSIFYVSMTLDVQHEQSISGPVSTNIRLFSIVLLSTQYLNDSLYMASVEEPEGHTREHHERPSRGHAYKPPPVHQSRTE